MKLLQTVLIEESFDIEGRGVAVVFRGSADGLPVGRAIPATLRRPDGSTLQTTAFVEWLLRRKPQPIERAALLLQGLTKADAPPGCTVDLFAP